MSIAHMFGIRPNEPNDSEGQILSFGIRYKLAGTELKARGQESNL